MGIEKKEPTCKIGLIDALKRQSLAAKCRNLDTIALLPIAGLLAVTGLLTTTRLLTIARLLSGSRLLASSRLLLAPCDLLGCSSSGSSSRNIRLLTLRWLLGAVTGSGTHVGRINHLLNYMIC